MTTKKINLIYPRKTGWMKTYKEKIKEHSRHEISDNGYSDFSLPLFSSSLTKLLRLNKKITDSENVNHFLSHDYLIFSNLPSTSTTLITVHDIYRLKTRKTIKDSLISWLSCRNLSKAERLIVPSISTKKDLIKDLKIKEEKIEVVPMGIDPQKFSKTESEKLDLPDNFLLYLGGSIERKNTEFLIDIFKELQDLNNLHLVIGGSMDDKSKSKIMKKSIKHDLRERVHFKGWIKDKNLPELYSRAKLYIHPSKYEGFGLTPLEAMACETPVVVSDRGSLPEVVPYEEMVSELEAAVFASKIRKLLKDEALYTEMSKKSRKNAESLTWKKTIARYDKIYDEVLENEA